VLTEEGRERGGASERARARAIFRVKREADAKRRERVTHDVPRERVA